ncbi:hypothetical protein AX16_009519 [Volvariella volvacea WC 439]|nr:hypothetical protein AX16_009519 [Volvariella volvacea WC 439]
MPDPRFARLKTDPRFRPIKRHKTKLQSDERFNAVFQPGFSRKTRSTRVDKYGRAISKSKEQENLKQLYHIENEHEVLRASLDYARGEVLLESSDEGEGESDKDEVVTIGDDPSRISLGTQETGVEVEVDLDEDTVAALDAQVEAYNRLNPINDHVSGARSCRLAVVNLDWDHVRAAHLYKVFASLLSPVGPPPSNVRTKGVAASVARGRLLSVRVYPSEFGKQRMAKEEKEGPPPEIFKTHEFQESEINEKTIHDVADAEANYNEDALRTYQLERLRYYYAIVTCDTVEAAMHLYSELDGTELERSANVLDLSFVPDEMSFDDKPRDEATEDIGTVKPLDFVTDALRHSKVKLTWDEDDPQRTNVTRRTLTQQEIDADDFRAYIASSESEDEGKPQKAVSRNRLRALLLGDKDDLPEGWARDEGKDNIDMEITFTPGLSKSTQKGDETTLDQYQRKTREKRKRRKEEKKDNLEQPRGSKPSDDDFFEVNQSDSSVSSVGVPSTIAGEPTVSMESRPSRIVEPQHFDMKAVIKAERKGKKGKRQKRTPNEGENVQEDFAIDVNDERFSALHEDHTFAIDPSNPHFKRTKAMSTLLEERSKRQRQRQEAGGNDLRVASTGLDGLVERIKRKSETVGRSKAKKLRKG